MFPLSPNELKVIRRRFGQTQGEMAEMLGVTRNTVTRWETDQQPIPTYLHAALYEYGRRLGVHLTEPEKPKKKASKNEGL